MDEIQEKEAVGIRYLERAGSGIPMVLLHGIGSNALSFCDLIKALPPGVRVIAWHAPGYAGSTPLDLQWPQADDYARALSVFLHALDIHQINLLGHSLGTLIASAFAVNYADKVRLLVLASCANGYEHRKGDALTGSLAERISDLEALGAQAFAAKRAHRLVYDPQNNPEVVATVQHNMSMIELHGYTQAVRMLAAGDLNSTMKHCAIPTRFIIAERDEITPEQQTLNAASAWAEANGQAPVIERIADAGHAVYLQKTAEFAAIVQKMIV